MSDLLYCGGVVLASAAFFMVLVAVLGKSAKDAADKWPDDMA